MKIPNSRHISKSYAIKSKNISKLIEHVCMILTIRELFSWSETIVFSQGTNKNGILRWWTLDKSWKSENLKEIKQWDIANLKT